MHQCGTVCADGVELMGLATATLVSGDPEVVVAYIPGQYDNAYQFRRSHALLGAASDAGMACLLANTRGQDSFCRLRRHPGREIGEDYEWAQLGSSFERVGEAGYDLEAWLSFIADLAPQARVSLVGHSHGALKIANYLLGDGGTKSDSLAGVVLLSPSDDIGCQRELLGDRYEEALDWAAQRVESGDDRALMPDWAYEDPISAGTYLEAYGPGSPLRTFAFDRPEEATIAAPEAVWPQPTLAVFGSDDIATGPVSSEEAIATMTRWFSGRGRLDAVWVAGAEHEYRGYEDRVAQIVIDWVGGLAPGVR
jgi:alpha-beta hydrolase superfamily lysophospholipase